MRSSRHQRSAASLAPSGVRWPANPPVAVGEYGSLGETISRGGFQKGGWKKKREGEEVRGDGKEREERERAGMRTHALYGRAKHDRVPAGIRRATFTNRFIKNEGRGRSKAGGDNSLGGRTGIG